MPEDKEIQPDQSDLQPEDQIKEEPQENIDDDDFEPKLDAKSYAKKWRETQSEAAKYRKELAALKAEKEKSEKAKLKEQGKYKEMYEALHEKHSGLESRLKTSAKSVAFRNEAIAQGCQPELVELLEKSASLNEIELDEKFRPDKDQVAFEVEKLKKQYGAHFFVKKGKEIIDGNPKKPDVKEKSFAEKVRQAKTQKELDALLAEINAPK